MKSLKLTPFTLCLCVTLSPVLVASCGGGGGGGGASTAQSVSPPPPLPPPPVSPPPPPPVVGNIWTQGTFPAATTFKSKCEAPRTGVDLEGNRFSDTVGTLSDEKFWLRSWSNETYLWNTEVADTDPALTPGKLDYFARLRTFATTISGKDKDDFHFSEPTSEALARRLSAASSSYGASFALISPTRPRDIRVRYTDADTPASQVVNGAPNLVRGTRILSINGIDAINGATNAADLEILNNGLFPPTAGTLTTMVVRDPGATTDRTITLISANLTPKSVNRTQVIDSPTGKVGYILFTTFSPFASEREIRDAIDTVKAENINDLVLDLRYNGGGLLTVASQLSYMIADPNATRGKTFEGLRFNAAAGNRNPVTGNVNNPIGFQTTGAGFSVPTGTALPNLGLRRVFILSTARTCSASEAVINGLRGADIEVVLIGGTTCGKPFGFYATDNCGETYYTIQFQGVNNAGFGDYADGFIPNNSVAQFGVRIPGCSVADDFNSELGNPQEALFAAALGYRVNGSCPAPTPISIAANQSKRADPAEPGIIEPRGSIFDNNRDMTSGRETRQ